MAQKLTDSLRKGKVLWLICGGSNIPLSAQAMDIVRAAVSAQELGNLTIGMTDERYGPLGHPDSNWKQLENIGFNPEGVTTIPILTGKSLHETVEDYGRKLEVALRGDPRIIGQFGIGMDGHIAGMLPHSPAISNTGLVDGYEAKPFTRITITQPVFEKISTAYVFVFGGSKQAVLKRLMNENLPIEEMPCQILKQLPEAYFYTDQIED